jgi:hypothetical protein
MQIVTKKRNLTVGRETMARFDRRAFKVEHA